eukprot:CAMPEP_0197322678 /NCGR_PEP_ID=MMETSP0891-20130614/70046_1 /TAXON_ID=44058 ORGANISM="Aureoumbra lagunensis, Strain CCMP1510" /NCGR_SAMPLE_ID=MMETSP0891 /ASSEMBLY_ACC=CAM_ASM_000534 /LENGTH=561 /DNA_ID=CAMNT_0042815129 /DNA_START=188 /DNA_END=1874 /DNA_ORIENTATION=+
MTVTVEESACPSLQTPITLSSILDNMNEVVSFQAPQLMPNFLPKQSGALDRSVSNSGTLLKNYESLSPEMDRTMVLPNFMAQETFSNSVVPLQNKNHTQAVIEKHFKNAGHDSSRQKWMDDANIPTDVPAENFVDVVERDESKNNENNEVVESDESKNNENNESENNKNNVDTVEDEIDVVESDESKNNENNESENNKNNVDTVEDEIDVVESDESKNNKIIAEDENNKNNVDIVEDKIDVVESDESKNNTIIAEDENNKNNVDIVEGDTNKNNDETVEAVEIKSDTNTDDMIETNNANNESDTSESNTNNYDDSNNNTWSLYDHSPFNSNNYDIDYAYRLGLNGNHLPPSYSNYGKSDLEPFVAYLFGLLAQSLSQHPYYDIYHLYQSGCSAKQKCDTNKSPLLDYYDLINEYPHMAHDDIVARLDIHANFNCHRFGGLMSNLNSHAYPYELEVENDSVRAIEHNTYIQSLETIESEFIQLCLNSVFDPSISIHEQKKAILSTLKSPGCKAVANSCGFYDYIAIHGETYYHGISKILESLHGAERYGYKISSDQLFFYNV